MREIIFRGKPTANEWVYGGLDNYDETKPRILTKDRGGLWNIGVRAETVGQFTGLTDKNGKRIFEGDIVKTHYANAKKADFVELVVFHCGKFCGMAKLQGGGRMYAPLADGVPHDPRDRSVYMDRVEVIGNIYDNPELLAEREDGEK